MEEALDQQQAAETLRAVEGMRRRTTAAVHRLSPLPPLIFGLATLVAAPFTLLTSYRAIERPPNVLVIGPDPGHRGIAAVIAMSLATIAAVALTTIYYRQQPVHPAPSQRKRWSTGEAIFFAVVLIVFGPGIIAFFLTFAPLTSGWTFIPFAALTLAALITAKIFKNGAIAVASIWGFVITGLSPFMWTDHWEFIAALGYAGSFLLAALVVRYAKRRPV